MKKRKLDDILIINEKTKESVSFTDLTHKERVEFTKDIDKEVLRNMLLILANCFRKCGDELDIEAEYYNNNINGYKRG